MEGDRLLTVTDVADWLGYSKSTILLWADKGKLPGFRMPDKQLRFREAAIAEWLKARATGPGEVT